MTFAAVGTIIQSQATTFSLTPHTIGDFILFEVTGNSTSSTPSSMSSTNVTWSKLGTAGTTDGGSPFNPSTAQVFLGTVTATSAATVTIAWSGTTPGTIQCAGQEFSTTAGNSSVTLDVQATLNVDGGTTTWSSLTPNHGAGELYFGYALDASSATAGSTSGYTYQTEANSNGMAYNVSCPNSGTDPVWGDAAQVWGVMVLVYEASTAAAPLPPRQLVPPGRQSPAAWALLQPRAAAAAAPQAVTVNAGLATATGTALSTAFTYAQAGLAAGTGTALEPEFLPYITQILGSGTAQHWGDQYGNPIMMKSDTPWALAYNAGNSGGATTYETDITNYCSTRSGQGFNCFLVNAPGTTQTGAASDDGATWDGVAPFTSPGVLNNAFWTRVDYVITTAAAYGMTVILNPMFSYSFSDAGGAMTSWSNANFTTYGTALGARYAAAPNLLWEFGDDYGGGNDPALTNCLTAIRAAGDTHLISVENLTPGDSRYALNGSSYAWGTSYANWNWCYGYGCAYNAVEYAYKESSPLLVMKADGTYDDGGNSDPRGYWRNWACWSLSAGSRGFQYGRNDVFPWPTGMISGGVLTDNHPDNTDFAVIWSIFEGLAEWYKLVPDTSSALVTSGRGTRWADSNDNYTFSSTNTYVEASITGDGNLAVIYCPNLTAATTFGINQSLLPAGYTATWIDPTNAATTTASTGSSYTTPGTNSLGAYDWLLALQAPAAVTVTAGLASGTGTAQQPVPQVTAAAGLASGTGAAQPPAIAIIANASLAAASGSAQPPVPAVAPAAGLAAGTGTSQPPAPAVIVNAGLAAGTGAALNTAFIYVQAGLASATGTAQQPVPVIAPAAGLAAGAGTAQPPAAEAGTFAGLAAGTGTAQAPVPVVTANAGLAAGTGTALNTAFTYAQAGLAGGTGTAQNPVPVIAPNAGLPAGTGTAQSPATAAAVTAGLATGTGVAQPPVPVIIANAGLASGTGTALNPTVNTSGNTTANAGLATGTGTAQPPVPGVAAAAGLAAGAGTALQPAVSTSGTTTANAGLATATGAAQQPAPDVIPGAGPATATGAAQAPAAAITVSAGLAAGAGTAQSPVPDAAAAASLAAGAGTALNPAVSTSGNTTANAGLATATGAAQAPAAGVQPGAGVAAGTGTAQSPAPAIGASPAPAIASGSAPMAVTSVTVTAGLATATGAAPQPVAVVTVALGLPAAAGTAQQPGITVTVIAGLATGTGTAPNAKGPTVVTAVLFSTGPARLPWATGQARLPWATGQARNG